MIRRTEAEVHKLLEQHERLIQDSAIAPEVAAERGYRSAQTLAELKRLGFGDSQRKLPALVIPVWNVYGEIGSYQIRPDEPRILDGKPLKYEFPSGSRMLLDVHPRTKPNLRNPQSPLLITEGIRKGDSAVSKNMCTITLLGVWNFRGTNELGGTALVADWEAVALNDRLVYVVFDSDAMVKPQVHAALGRLGGWLESRRASVQYVYLPSGEGGSKVGLDDFLAAGHGVDDLLALASPDLRRLAGEPDSAEAPYVTTPAGLVWRKPVQGGTVDVPLANFAAEIVADVIEDDGVEERRVYRLEAVRGQRSTVVDVPASQFPGMGWISEQLGASAIVSPGFNVKDHLRCAIQSLSGEIPESRVFTHTGWRQIDGVWAYLHADGAIGPDGQLPGVSVALHGPLARFRLPDPQEGDNLIQAVKTALELLELLPLDIAVPLLAAAWLAPLRALLGEDTPDFVVWLHGQSGTFKSELLAIAQAFFGDFSRLSLPANFLITPNALLAVDDYHPAGDPKEAQAMAQVAHRLLRGVGNAAGRTRMRADTSLRAGYPPRCVAIASGERLPEGHSHVARMFPLSVAPGAIDSDLLAEAQDSRALYAVAMAGYIRYLAARFQQLQAELPARFRNLRREAQVAGGHRREPGQIAHLLLGLERFLDFAIEIGAILATYRDVLLRDARRVLLTHAQEHADSQADEAPELLFLRLLADGFAAKRAYLEAKSGGAPDDAKRWGWELAGRSDWDRSEQDEARHLPAGLLVGAVDDEWLYLYPDAAYQFVAESARRAGRVFPVELATLVRRLAEAGLIFIDEESGNRRLRVNVWLGGATRRVIQLRRDVLETTPPLDHRVGAEAASDPNSNRSDVVSAGTDSPLETGVAGVMSLRNAPIPAIPGLPSLGEEEAAWSP